MTRRRSRRGQAAVELSLMFMTFTTVLIGVFEFGRLAAVYISMLNAAREGAADWRDSQHASDSSITTAVTNNILAFGSGTFTTSICPTTIGASSTCSPMTSSFARSSGGALVVSIQYTFYFFPPLSIGAPDGVQLNVSAVTGIG